jgi:hypothetical protein
MNPKYLSAFFLVLLLMVCCREKRREMLFSDVTKAAGIDFENRLLFTDTLNPYTYRNFYNGAGVALGDINNDGLLDLYFAGNQADNKLYLNKGNFKFEDITEKAGVTCAGVWSTGVTMADVNSDGYLDIYVCKSGSPSGSKRNNELFINNGDLTFTEKAKEFGLDVVGLSVQAAFFDYDKDGDLDCYLLTNSFKSVGNFDLIKDQRLVPDSLGGGNKFFINNSGRFVDYTSKANIFRSSIGFGLGITLGDFNNDNWTDIYISNDFFERDYLYINDQKGSFQELLTTYFQSISMGSMGADFADLDNDGENELFVTEMLPDSLNRRKSKTIYEGWNKYQLNLDNGYYHQFSRNVLQTKIDSAHFAEIGRLAGVAATEWSWGALLFDMDNDGLRDIFIANGIYKDLLDRDYLTYTGAEENVRKIIKSEKNAIVKLIDLMPSSKFSNYAYHNKGKFQFINKSNEWGLGEPMYSSGSAYGDLDNDGDLDLVVSNINSKSIVYRNNTDTTLSRSICVSLRSSSSNRFAISAKLKVYAGTKMYYADNFVTRGYQSATTPDIHMGVGKTKVIDSLIVQWPNNQVTKLYAVPTNKSIVIEDGEAKQGRFANASLLSPLKLTKISGNFFKHLSSGLVDFNRDRLLPMMYSNETPFFTKGDIDRDGYLEVYVGGGKGQSGALIQFTEKGVRGSKIKGTYPHELTEETKSIFFDVDQDGDLDLYFAAGGRFFPKSSSALSDLILLNDGKGHFSKSEISLPFTDFVSTSVVKPIDFDNDHDLDLFIGERFDPFNYGSGGRGYLLKNDGSGRFTDVTSSLAPSLLTVGMVTDAEVQDLNSDGWSDLVLVGDWMPISILMNSQSKFSNQSAAFGLKDTEGWWTDIETGDFNQDGQPDFVIGNHGLNTFFKANDRLYISDFDKNGSMDQIYCTKIGEKYYPVLDKDELVSQLPVLRKDLLYFRDYSKRSIDQIFPSAIQQSKFLEAKLLTSIVLLSNGGTYQIFELPLRAQFSPIYSLLVEDFDNDGIEDVIAGGNQYQVKPQFGRFDASSGWFFRGRLSNGNFTFDDGVSLGVTGQIRDIECVNVKGKKYVLFTKHNDELEIYRLSN